MATMTPEEYNKRLTELYGLVSGDLAQDVIVPAAIVMQKAIVNRIVNQGKNSAGGNIGDYSTKELYAEKSQFAKPGAFKAEGKSKGIGDVLVPTVLFKQSKNLKLGHKFLPVVQTGRKYKRYTQLMPNYKERKTMYLEEGYKQLRDIQNLRTDVMNYKYRGDMINDFKLQKEAQAVLLGFTQDKESKKRKSLEAKRGAAFSPTQQELQNYSETVNFNLRRITQNTLEGVYVSATVE